MAQSIIGVGVDIMGRDTFSPAAKSAQKSMAGLAVSAGRTLSIVGTISRQFGLMMTRWGKASLGFLGSSVNSAGKLQDELIYMQALSEDLAADNGAIDKLRKKFLDLSDPLPLSAVEMAKVGVVAASMGVATKKSAKEGLQPLIDRTVKFTVVASKFAAVSRMTEEASARQLGFLGAAMGVPIENADLLASTIRGLVTKTNARAPELLNIGRRFGGLAKVMGVSASDALSLAAAIRQVGAEPRRAAGALGAFFSKATIKADEFAKIAGVSTATFRTMMADSPMETALAFFAQLGQSVKENKGMMGPILKDLGLNTVAAMSSILPMMNREGVDKIRKIQKHGARFWADALAARKDKGKTSELDRQFKKMAEGFTLSLKSLKGAIGNFMITAGTPLLKYVIKFMKWLTKIINKMRQSGKWFKTTGVLLFGMAGAFLLVAGAAATFFGWAIKGLAIIMMLGGQMYTLIPQFFAWAKTVKVLVVLWAHLKALMMGIGGVTLKSVAVGFAKIVAAAVILGLVFRALWPLIRTVGIAMWEAFVETFNMMKPAFLELGAALGDLFKELWGLLKVILSPLIKLGDIANDNETFWKKFGKALKWTILIPMKLLAIGLALVVKLLTILVKVASAVVNSIALGLVILGNCLVWLWDKFWIGMKQMAKVNPLLRLVIWLFKSLGSMITSLGQIFHNLAYAIYDSIWGSGPWHIPEAVDLVGKAFGSLLGWVGLVVKAFLWMKGNIFAVFTGIISKIGSAAAAMARFGGGGPSLLSFLPGGGLMSGAMAIRNMLVSSATKPDKKAPSVTTEAGLAASAAAAASYQNSGGGMSVPIIIQLDGRTVWESVVKLVRDGQRRNFQALPATGRGVS